MRQLRISKKVTNRETLSLDKYLQDISKVALITSEEEVELAKRIRSGDQEALEKLTKANLRFVVSVSKQYQHQGLSLPDLINEGNLGLIKAAERFDETRGFKFISYAVWWIRQSILQALAEQARIVRLPLNKISSINQINRKLNELEQQFERLPTNHEIADMLDLHEDEISETLRIGHKHVSMDAPLSNDEESGSMYEVLVDEDIDNPDHLLIKESLKKEIERSLTCLSEREKIIINLFFGLNEKAPLSLEDIGETCGLTRERVRQIREKALKKLKHNSRINLLKSYL